MTWTFETQRPAPYARNSLVAVVAQLSFYPVLKLKERVADFQDEVRGTYPEYGEGEHRNVTLGPNDEYDVEVNPQFVFHDEEHARLITLRNDSVSFETAQHRSRNELVGEFRQVIDALTAVYDVEPARLGLRYINLIDRHEIENELDDQLAWSDLIQPEFLPLPQRLVDLAETSFYSEVNSTREPGRLVLRYGMIGDAEEGNLQYRLDFDRYTERDIQLDRIDDLIQTFSEDIFSLFMEAANSELLRWMKLEEQT